MENKSKKQTKIKAKKYEGKAYEPNRSLPNGKSGNKDMSMNDIVGLAWGAKEILRDDFKKTDCSYWQNLCYKLNLGIK